MAMQSEEKKDRSLKARAQAALAELGRRKSWKRKSNADDGTLVRDAMSRRVAAIDRRLRGGGSGAPRRAGRGRAGDLPLRRSFEGRDHRSRHRRPRAQPGPRSRRVDRRRVWIRRAGNRLTAPNARPGRAADGGGAGAPSSRDPGGPGGRDPQPLRPGGPRRRAPGGAPAGATGTVRWRSPLGSLAARPPLSGRTTNRRFGSAPSRLAPAVADVRGER